MIKNDGTATTMAVINDWPLVQFHPIHAANFNHADQEKQDDFAIDALLKEFRETRGLRKALDAVQRQLTVIQGGLQ